MKNTKNRHWHSIKEMNKPITNPGYLRVMQHPSQVDCIENDSIPAVTIWDSIDIDNGHDIATLNKRGLFADVHAEKQQLRSRGCYVPLQWETGSYPCIRERDGDGSLAALLLTETFSKNRYSTTA